MEVTIAAKDFSLTPSLRGYIQQRAEKLAHYRRDIIRVNVTLDIERHHTKGKKCVVEAQIMLPGKDINAEARGEEMRVAIDAVLPKLVAQLHKSKEMLLSRRKRASS